MKHVDALSRYLTMTIVDQSISMGKQKAQEQDDQDDGKDSYNDYFFRGGVVHKLVNDTELVVVHICKGKSSRKIHASKKFRYLISIRIAEVAPFGKKCATSAGHFSESLRRHFQKWLRWHVQTGFTSAIRMRYRGRSVSSCRSDLIVPSAIANACRASTCYIRFNECNLPFYRKTNGYKLVLC